MYVVYVLKSLKDSKLYVGQTSNLRKRRERHNLGMVQSRKWRRPLELIYYEEYSTRGDAIKREKYMKSLEGGSI